MDLALLISKFLSVGIIAGSLLFKVPQIMKLRAAKSAVGVSMMMIVLETFGHSITVGYSWNKGFALSTYAESFVVILQNFVLIWMIATYNRTRGPALYVGGLLYIAVMLLVLAGSIPFEFLAFLMLYIQIPISSASRIPQILTIFKNKSTGQLSFITTFLAFGGCMARMFTTFKETKDFTTLAGYTVGAVLNGTLVLLFLVFRPGAKKEK